MSLLDSTQPFDTHSDLYSTNLVLVHSLFPAIENMGNHVVLFGLLVLALIGLGLASNEPNLADNSENEPNNVNEYTDLFGPYSTVFSDYLASVSFLFSLLPFSNMYEYNARQARDRYYTKKINQTSHYNFRVVQILGNVGQVPKRCFVELIWRTGGTQAKKSAKFG